MKTPRLFTRFSPLSRTISTLTRSPLRRALLYVPGSEERRIQSASQLNLDCLVYDLEDGVAFNQKSKARQLVLQALKDGLNAKAEKAVRINSINSGLILDDLNIILQSESLQTIVLPKVQSASDIHFLTNIIDSNSTQRNWDLKIVACIESALGIVNVKEIAQSDPRITALLFAAEDYCADTGCIRTPSRKELLFPRSIVSTVASAYGLESIDMVCMDFRNLETLSEECQEAKEMGFTGKQAIHPSQLKPIQETFIPSAQEIERSLRIVNGYHQHSQAGRGAFDLDGKAIDLPVVKWAQRVLEKAKSADLLN